jgi:hypothetical protein
MYALFMDCPYQEFNSIQSSGEREKYYEYNGSHMAWTKNGSAMEGLQQITRPNRGHIFLFHNSDWVRSQSHNSRFWSGQVIARWSSPAQSLFVMVLLVS